RPRGRGSRPLLPPAGFLPRRDGGPGVGAGDVVPRGRRGRGRVSDPRRDRHPRGRPGRPRPRDGGKLGRRRGDSYSGGARVFPAARRLAARGIAPDGSRVNVRNMKPRVETGPGVGEDDFLLLCDAQTSGGLLVALPAASAEAYAAKCREGGATSAAVVGRVVEAGEKRLRVTK